MRRAHESCQPGAGRTLRTAFAGGVGLDAPDEVRSALGRVHPPHPEPDHLGEGSGAAASIPRPLPLRRPLLLEAVRAGWKSGAGPLAKRLAAAVKRHIAEAGRQKSAAKEIRPKLAAELWALSSQPGR